jgi:hypothetical protein
VNPEATSDVEATDREAPRDLQGSASEWDSDDEVIKLVPASSTADWTGMVVAELKEECKKLGLKVTGKKADLIKRLEKHSAAGESAAAGGFQASVPPQAAPSEGSPPKAQADADGARAAFEKCTIAELKAALKGAGQKMTGKKAELVERCVDNNVPVPS